MPLPLPAKHCDSTSHAARLHLSRREKSSHQITARNQAIKSQGDAASSFVIHSSNPLSQCGQPSV